MPPAAATVAGRRSDRPAAPPRTPRGPRRVSGPVSRPESRTETRQRARPDVRPSSRAAAAAVALEAQLAPAPTRPRREAPARRPAREAPARQRATTTRRVRAEAVAPRPALRLDRIVRGRAWIPVLGALLVAIVGLRVEVLKLGAGVGSQVQQATALQSSNAALRSQISALSDDQRIAKLAASYGMHMPNPLDVHFVQASAGHHIDAAIRNLSGPDRQAFLTNLADEQHSDQASTQAGSGLSAVGGPSSNTSLTPAAGSTTVTSTSGQVTNGASSTPSAGYVNTGASTTGGTTASTGTSSGTSSAGGTPPASSGGTTSSTTGADTTNVGTGGAGGTSLAPSTGQTTGSTSAGTSQTTGSTSGGTGLAG